MLIHARNNIVKVQDMEGMLKGQPDCELLWSIKTLFQGIPSYDKYIELDMEARKMIGFTCPMCNQWNIFSIFNNIDISTPSIAKPSQGGRR